MIAVAQLKAAYRASGLAFQGKSFADAMSRPALLRTLQAHAAALCKNMERRGKTLPTQQELPL